jgi:hypothetical protein
MITRSYVDNHLVLPEVQPWLMELAVAAAKRRSKRSFAHINQS